MMNETLRALKEYRYYDPEAIAEMVGEYYSKPPAYQTTPDILSTASRTSSPVSGVAYGLLLTKSKQLLGSDLSYGTISPQIKKNHQKLVSSIPERYLDWLRNELEESEFDVNARLIPPPMPRRRIKVKLKSVGKLSPRIKYDPEQE